MKLIETQSHLRPRIPPKKNKTMASPLSYRFFAPSPWVDHSPNQARTSQLANQIRLFEVSMKGNVMLCYGNSKNASITIPNKNMISTSKSSGIFCMCPESLESTQLHNLKWWLSSQELASPSSNPLQSMVISWCLALHTSGETSRKPFI